MRKVLLLAVVGLLCISLSSLAGEVITNDTGGEATGLRVVFSMPVQITVFGDILMYVDQEGRAQEFMFSGGTVSPWGSHWLNWSPTTARVVEYEWLIGSTTALQGLPGEQRADRPVVTGNLLNSDYFSHPAYVMQGVSDRDAVFAMPLDGIRELQFYPGVDGVDMGNVTWFVKVSHPEGIGASIEGKTLYIWGSNASWAGYGEVTLEAVLSDAVSSVSIPVTVFRDDKTLINAEGKKDYFVPWSPELDINRIMSVEEHMRKYNKDEGSLDRTIQWSRWKKMEYRWDVDLSSIWLNERINWADWPVTSQLALVDVYLSELVRLGIQSVRSWNEYYIESHTGFEISAVHHVRFAGPTKRHFEEAYIVDEAHRLGLTVSLGNSVSVGNPTTGEWEEIFAASPSASQEFFDNYSQLNDDSLSRWQQLGVNMVDLCPGLSSLNQYDNTYAEATLLSNAIEQMVARARESFDGPIYHGAHFQVDFFPGQSILQAPFWNSFDITGLSAWNIDLTRYPNPRIDQLISGWRDLIDRYFQPFQQRFDKPFLMWENGCFATEGCANYGLICSRIEGFDATKPSTEEMAKYYIAHDGAFQKMEGYFGPGWFAYPLAPDHQGGVRDTTNITFRLKIEDTIQQLCLGSVSHRLIEIDGDDSDWVDEYTIGIDPVGDSIGASDLTEVAFTKDDAYWYFRIAFASPPDIPAYIRIFIDETGDGQTEWELYLNNIWNPAKDWLSMWTAFLHERNINQGPRRGTVDTIEGSNFIEIRLARRFFGTNEPLSSFRVRVVQYSQSWNPLDEMGWFSIGGPPSGESPLPASSVFEILDCGNLTTDTSVALQGDNSMTGEYYGDHSFTPFFRTEPSLLPLTPQGRYEVCFDYRIQEANPEGFEVLFFSPTGARNNNWVPPLRIKGDGGHSGHARLEGQLHSYSDYEIRWNVIANGTIVIDDITVRDLSTNQIVAEEDFEDWK